MQKRPALPQAWDAGDKRDLAGLIRVRQHKLFERRHTLCFRVLAVSILQLEITPHCKVVNIPVRDPGLVVSKRVDDSAQRQQ